MATSDGDMYMDNATANAFIGTAHTAGNSAGTVWVNSTPTPAVGQPVPYVTSPHGIDPSIHLDGKEANINFDGVKLDKEDVELLHLLLAKLKGKLIHKRASEKELGAAIEDAVKELGG